MSTRLYTTNDCRVSLPDGFIDRTTNLLEWTTEGGDTLVLVIQREKLPALDDLDTPRPAAVVLEQYVADQTKDYAARFAAFRVERDEVASTSAAVERRRKAFRWQSGQDILYHHQLFVLVDRLVIIFTAAGKARHRDHIDRIIAEASNRLDLPNH